MSHGGMICPRTRELEYPSFLISTLLGLVAHCAAMQPGPGRSLRSPGRGFAAARVCGRTARPCNRVLVARFARCSAMQPGVKSELVIKARVRLLYEFQQLYETLRVTENRPKSRLMI